MQEYSLIPSLGYDSPGVFWDEVTELCIRYRMDSISAYLYYLQKKFNEAGTPLKKDMFRQPGLEIELFPGVKTWFRRINDYGRKAGFLVEHYIISSGMAEIIENSEIADEFRKIYARVLEEIKSWAPNLDTLSYHPWTPEVTARVNAWIDVVLAGNDPRTATAAPAAAATVDTPAPAPAVSTPSVASVEAEEIDDLPF
jgi:hypothetical protein